MTANKYKIWKLLLLLFLKFIIVITIDVIFIWFNLN